MNIINTTNPKRKFRCCYCGLPLDEKNGGSAFGMIQPPFEIAHHFSCFEKEPEAVTEVAQRLMDKFFNENPRFAPAIRPRLKANYAAHTGCVRCGSDVLSEVDGAILANEHGAFTACMKCLTSHQTETMQLLESAISQLPKQGARRAVR